MVTLLPGGEMKIANRIWVKMHVRVHDGCRVNVEVPLPERVEVAEGHLLY